MLVMQCTNEASELDVNLDEATLEKEYGGQIQSHMTGSFSNLVAKTFKVITKKKVFIPGKFANSNQQACVKCALRANEGHLYPLEKQFIFIHKPAVLIRFDEIESVEFQRYAGGQGSTRNFDLSVNLLSTPGDNTSVKEYIFSGIDKTNYSALYSFLSGKKIKIKNIEEAGGEEESPRGAPMYNEMDDDDEEESEDEDYDQQKASESESEDVSGGDDDDMGSVVSDDSDLAEYKKKAKKVEKAGSAKNKKKEKKSKGSDDDEESSPKKRKAAGGKKKKKDPSAPKNAKSAYMYFSSAKRDEIKAANPDAGFGQIVSEATYSIFMFAFCQFLIIVLLLFCRGNSLARSGRSSVIKTRSSMKKKQRRTRSATKKKWRITIRRQMTKMMIRTMAAERRK
jgi:structure-specific recognition protein 1